jgi:hypothetical protein
MSSDLSVADRSMMVNRDLSGARQGRTRRSARRFGKRDPLRMCPRRFRCSALVGKWDSRTCPTGAEHVRFSRMERKRPTRRANQSVHQFCCLAPVEKYSGFPKTQISLYPSPSRSSEGRCATSRNAERDAVDAGGALDGRLLLADGEVVWS